MWKGAITTGRADGGDDCHVHPTHVHTCNSAAAAEKSRRDSASSRRTRQTMTRQSKDCAARYRGATLSFVMPIEKPTPKSGHRPQCRDDRHSGSS